MEHAEMAFMLDTTSSPDLLWSLPRASWGRITLDN